MEGHDREVLAGLDTEAVQIDVLVVEMNDNKRLWEVLWGRGYSCVTCVYDCVFVHGASKHAERLDELNMGPYVYSLRGQRRVVFLRPYRFS